MTTITIDIPDNNTAEVITQLKKFGVKVRESKLAKLDALTKEDYQKHFANQAKANKNICLNIYDNQTARYRRDRFLYRQQTRTPSRSSNFKQ